MPCNSHLLNTWPINADIDPTDYYISTIDPILIEQQVARTGSGDLILIEQDVRLRLSTTEETDLILIEQNVTATGSGDLILIEQRQRDSTVEDRIDRYGWDATLTIGGWQVPADQICGNLTINREESGAALMNVTLFPEDGPIDLDFYHGKSITVDYHTSSGTTRMYTGIVDIPEIDVIEDKITLRCTDRRQELLNNQLGAVVDTIGVYSDLVFSEPHDVAEEVEQRLTTVPASVDFDAAGNYTYTSLYPKAVADFTVTDSDVYIQKPRITWASRARIVNKVNIALQYRFDRFYHHTRHFTWHSPIETNICLMLKYGYTVPQRSMILAAIAGAGWQVDGEVTFTPIHDDGWYNCEGETIGWFTTQYFAEEQEALDEKGMTKKDAKGNTVYEAYLTGFANYSDLYCMAAEWNAATQWAQYVNEDYTLTVQAPQSIAQYGELEQSDSCSVDNESNSERWENFSSFSNVGGSANYYIDQDTQREDVRNALDVLLQKAQTTILRSHRDTRVSFATALWPEIDLTHTVEIDTTKVEAKGKVYQIQHEFDLTNGFARTSTTIALFRAQGSQSSDALEIPDQPSDNISFNTSNIILGNHYGEDPTTEAAQVWTGMIGNKYIPWVNPYYAGQTFYYKTAYQEQFIVDVPAIPDALRNTKELEQTASYDLEIPNDTCIYTKTSKYYG